MTAERDAFTEAHRTLGETLNILSGLLTALYEVAREHDGLNNPEPMSNAILSLMIVVDGKAEAALAQHEAVWAAVVKRPGAAT